MKYTVVFTQGALKSLKKLDKPTAALIVGWTSTRYLSKMKTEKRI